MSCRSVALTVIAGTQGPAVLDARCARGVLGVRPEHIELALGEGRGCYAAYLTPQGRMIADMRLFETGEHLPEHRLRRAGSAEAQRSTGTPDAKFGKQGAGGQFS